jgi:hypothetical protein
MIIQAHRTGNNKSLIVNFLPIRLLEDLSEEVSKNKLGIGC